MTAVPDPRSEQVLVLAPIGRDAHAAELLLRQAGISTVICSNVGDLLRRMEHEAGVALVAEEGFGREIGEQLVHWVEHQPPWSDFPFVVLTSRRTMEGIDRKRLRLLSLLKNVSLLERPVHAVTLVSAVQAALRARRRQYEVRGHLLDREQAAEHLESLVAERTRQLEATNERLCRAKDEAERANLAKSKFLAAASHDLRQPLQSLILFAGVLKGYVQGSRGEQALKHLEAGLGALKALLDSLLDVSKLDAGMVTPEITEFPISAVLEEIAASYAPFAATKGLGWRVEPCADRVRSDRTLLGRVLRNLVENALRYTASGHIRIVCGRVGDRLHIAVEDTGIGIPPEHLDRIFEEFHQVGNLARDRSQGLGLGLAIVRRISNLLGHRVEARSKPDEGSTFSIELPLGIQEPARPPDREDASPGQDGRGQLAVVVDDDAMVLDSLEAILTEWGYEALTATDAEQAVAEVREMGRRPDIVIADYRLREGRTGMEAIHAVRALFDQLIPGVILTGETGLEFIRTVAGQDVGIAHKPVTPRDLGRVLDQQFKAANKP
jgi:two-component system, sensor histidine kinase